jgi:hypothetical protein
MSDKQKIPSSIKLISIKDAPALPDVTADDATPRVVDPSPFSPNPEMLGGIVFKNRVKPLVNEFLAQSFNLYRGKCECGVTYDNNCAHFLTDAMVRAGLPSAFPVASEKCSAGRLIRAKECLAWFRDISTGFAANHDSLSSGYWFVYQESGGQGHVCIHLEGGDKYSWKGTTDLPNWPVQWHYFY